MAVQLESAQTQPFVVMIYVYELLPKFAIAIYFFNFKLVIVFALNIGIELCVSQLFIRKVIPVVVDTSSLTFLMSLVSPNQS